jgi:hypothetical protein
LGLSGTCLIGTCRVAKVVDSPSGSEDDGIEGLSVVAGIGKPITDRTLAVG